MRDGVGDENLEDVATSEGAAVAVAALGLLEVPHQERRRALAMIQEYSEQVDQLVAAWKNLQTGLRSRGVDDWSPLTAPHLAGKNALREIVTLPFVGSRVAYLDSRVFPNGELGAMDILESSRGFGLLRSSEGGYLAWRDGHTASGPSSLESALGLIQTLLADVRALHLAKWE